jgi:hypothetical protein
MGWTSNERAQNVGAETGRSNQVRPDKDVRSFG